jgi:hypothetical protein
MPPTGDGCEGGGGGICDIGYLLPFCLAAARQIMGGMTRKRYTVTAVRQAGSELNALW